MQGYGYTIIPMHPGVSAVLGEKAYGKRADVPLPIDLANVFRRAQHIDEVVDECLTLDIKRCRYKRVWSMCRPPRVPVPAASPL
jgi:predicted CoA-binding protein